MQRDPDLLDPVLDGIWIENDEFLEIRNLLNTLFLNRDKKETGRNSGPAGENEKHKKSGKDSAFFHNFWFPGLLFLSFLFPGL